MTFSIYSLGCKVNIYESEFVCDLMLKNNFILGIPGELELTNFQLITGDNDPIPLRGNINDKGEGRYWAHIGWFFLFPLLLVKGGDGKIPATVQYTMYTMEEVEL